MDKHTGSSGFKRLGKFMSEHKWKYLTAVMLLIVVNLLHLATPRITGWVVDMIREQNIEKRGLLFYAGLIVAFSFVAYIFNYLSRMQVMGASQLYEFAVRNSMFRHLEKMTMSFFSKKSVGELMALSINDLNAVRMAIGRGILTVVNTLFLIVSSAFILWQTIDIRLTLLAFSPFPLLVFTMSRFGKIINKRFKAVQESFADMTRAAQENISGIRVVKAFTQENAETENFAQVNLNNYKAQMSLTKVRGLFQPLITVIASISYLIAMMVAAPLILKNEISLGDYIALNSYIGMLIHPIAFIGMIVNEIQQAKASMGRIEDLFNEQPEIFDREDLLSRQPKIPDGADLLVDGQEKVRFKGDIEFRNVTFSYGDENNPVLKNVTFRIHPGETAAFVGKIGSGKTTVVELLLRLYNPSGRGQIFIDGTDIMDIPLETLRGNIGYVPQDNVLFSTTIRDNIAFTPEKVPDEEVETAAKISHVYDDIMEFPEKFETLLGERGVNLSGGQKQRVSIARAFAKNPPILILDDCLSAVDTNTEELILSRLNEETRERTCIMIAHRISTIKNADIIFVLDDGKIIERGNHAQLLENKGYYSRIYEMQLLEDKLAQEGEF